MNAQTVSTTNNQYQVTPTYDAENYCVYCGTPLAPEYGTVCPKCEDALFDQQDVHKDVALDDYFAKMNIAIKDQPSSVTPRKN